MVFFNKQNTAPLHASNAKTTLADSESIPVASSSSLPPHSAKSLGLDLTGDTRHGTERRWSLVVGGLERLDGWFVSVGWMVGWLN